MRFHQHTTQTRTGGALGRWLGRLWRRYIFDEGHVVDAVLGGAVRVAGNEQVARALGQRRRERELLDELGGGDAVVVVNVVLLKAFA